jgi:uncharacterized protein YuzE
MAKLTIWWDQESDFLELSIGKARKGFFKDVGNDVLVRIDAKSGKPIGFAILNFRKRFKKLKKPRRLELPIEVSFSLNL